MSAEMLCCGGPSSVLATRRKQVLARSARRWKRRPLNSVGRTVPKEYIPASREVSKAWWPRVWWPASRWSTSGSRWLNGKYHDVDSSLLAFEIAARAAFREALFRKHEPRCDAAAVAAPVTLMNMFGYAITLRPTSLGGATLAMQLDHYAPVPPPQDDLPFSARHGNACLSARYRPAQSARAGGDGASRGTGALGEIRIIQVSYWRV